MESASIITPTGTNWHILSFIRNPIFLKDQNMKKYQHYIDAGGGGVNFRFWSNGTHWPVSAVSFWTFTSPLFFCIVYSMFISMFAM